MQPRHTVWAASAGYGLSSSAAQSREHGIFLKVNRIENLPVSQVFLYQSILMCHFPYGAHGLSILEVTAIAGTPEKANNV